MTTVREVIQEEIAKWNKEHGDQEEHGLDWDNSIIHGGIND